MLIAMGMGMAVGCALAFDTWHSWVPMGVMALACLNEMTN